MAAVEEEQQNLARTASQTSTASRRSGTARIKSRKQSLVTPSSAKTLESFPSLSPEASPGPKQGAALLARKNASPTDETPRGAVKTGPSIVQSLVTSSPSFRGRSALFDDSVAGDGSEVLGALHHATDDSIQRLISKRGAVAMVRQLALDLADRDAEMTIFRRKAEERERELKRMLREVEVSNMDIEKRLHRLEGPEDAAPLQKTPSKPQVKTNTAGGATTTASPSEADALDELMGEAMKGFVGITEIDEGYLDSLGIQNNQTTVRASSSVYKDSDNKSVSSSVVSQGQSSDTVRGWKDYIWSGNGTHSKSSRASSVTDDQGDREPTLRDRRLSNNARRKGLTDGTFQPPKTTDGNSTVGRSSRKSSSSITNWTMKLFAGNGNAEGQGGRRSRATSAAVQSADSRAAEEIPPVPPIPQSAKAALMRVNSMETTRAARAATPSKSRAPAASTDRSSSQQPSTHMPLSPTTANGATNLGPVEMDTIHPADSKPPTLAPTYDRKNSAGDELLTDRFGFIYDQRRRKKEAETTIRHHRGKSNASSHVEFIGGVRQPKVQKENDKDSTRARTDSLQRPETPMSGDDRSEGRPTKRWQDFLTVATAPTELLSHTPITQPTTTVISPESTPISAKGNAMLGSIRSPSLSQNPEPAMTPVTAQRAELASTTQDPTSSDESPVKMTEHEPVKLLLSHLTEVHDTLQREKTVKWNEFLRKVRAERKREGETAALNEGRSRQAANTPEVMLTDGEVIGVAGLGNKGKVGRAKWKEFKQLVLGGIPVSYRAKIWAECSGASALRVPGYYDELVAGHDNDDPTIVAQIQMDIHRTLTDNVFFRKGPGVNKLNEVLLAYARRNPEVGYCQGMNLIAASLLLIMATAEDAFWLLTSLIENILPRHYYDHSLLASRADQQVLRSYVTSLLPKLSAHLDDLGIELEALTFQWFLSVFTDCLSAEALFRVWDVVLCFNDGSTFLFQVALALLKLNEAALLECETPAGVYGYIGNEMTDHAISIDGLIGASEALKNVVTRAEVEEKRWAAVEEQRGRERSAGRVRGGSGTGSGSGSVSGRTSERSGSVTGETNGGLMIAEPRPMD